MLRKQEGINAYHRQQKVGVEVANPEQLVGTLFDKLMETLARARHFLELKNYPNKIDRINLAMDIIQVLEQSLDHDCGGELADNLQALYQYCLKRLMQANASNDVAAIDEVSGLMGEIHEAWKFILKGAVEPTVANTE